MENGLPDWPPPPHIMVFPLFFSFFSEPSLSFNYSIQVLPEVNILTASIRLFSANEAIKQSPKEVDNVLVIGEHVSVNEPAVVGNNPTDPVRMEAVVQEVEDSIDTSLASTNYHVVRVAVLYPGQAWTGIE